MRVSSEKSTKDLATERCRSRAGSKLDKALNFPVSRGKLTLYHYWVDQIPVLSVDTGAPSSSKQPHWGICDSFL